MVCVNLYFVVVIFLVAFKRLNVLPASFLSVWDHYCYVRCQVKSIKNLQARNSAPFRVGALDVFENLDHDTVTGFEQIMPTTPGESNRAKSSSTAQQHLHALQH